MDDRYATTRTSPALPGTVAASEVHSAPLPKLEVELQQLRSTAPGAGGLPGSSGTSKPPSLSPTSAGVGDERHTCAVCGVVLSSRACWLGVTVLATAVALAFFFSFREWELDSKRHRLAEQCGAYLCVLSVLWRGWVVCVCVCVCLP